MDNANMDPNDPGPWHMMQDIRKSPTCSNKCFARVTMPIIIKLRRQFQEIGDFGLQNAYIQKHAKKYPIKCRRNPGLKPNDEHRRNCTIRYTLGYANKTYSVCKKDFLNILGITAARVQTALMKVKPLEEQTPQTPDSEEVNVIIQHQFDNEAIANKSVQQEDANLKGHAQPSTSLNCDTTESVYLDQESPSHLDTSRMTTLSQLVEEVRQLYVSKVYRTSPHICNAMSPRVILIRPTQKYIEKYTMMGQVKNEPLSDDEEAWDSNWNMNLLEPLVEISDNPKDNSKKRRRRSTFGGTRKRTKTPSGNQSHHQNPQPGESEFVNVSIKQEPAETVPVPFEDVPHNVPMATIPVGGGNVRPLPVYQIPTPKVAVYVHKSHPVVLQPTVQNQQGNKNSPSTSNTTRENIQPVINVEANVKQEQMENVFVMPFGGDIENENQTASEKESCPQPEIIECESAEETTRKNRKAAIVENIASNEVSGTRKLRELTYKLVELNNKNLQCDSRIDKIKDEFNKRLKVVELEKKGIEQEIDRVLASIQDWKETKQ